MYVYCYRLSGSIRLLVSSPPIERKFIYFIERCTIQHFVVIDKNPFTLRRKCIPCFGIELGLISYVSHTIVDKFLGFFDFFFVRKKNLLNFILGQYIFFLIAMKHHENNKKLINMKYIDGRGVV